jgi:hypothetical protein
MLRGPVPQAETMVLAVSHWVNVQHFGTSGSGIRVRCWEVEEQGGQIRASPKVKGKATQGGLTVKLLLTLLLLLLLFCYCCLFFLQPLLPKVEVSTRPHTNLSFFHLLHYLHYTYTMVNHADNAPRLGHLLFRRRSNVFSVGADKAVRMWQLGPTPPNNTPQQIGSLIPPAWDFEIFQYCREWLGSQTQFWDIRQ